MPPPNRIRLRHVLIFLALAIVGLIVLVTLWNVFELDGQKIRGFIKTVADWMGTLPPVPFAICCVFIFLFPMPASAVFIGAGAAWGVQKGFAVAAFGILGNQLLAYFLASRWMREPIRRLLARRGYNLPEVPPGKSADVVLLIRLAPAAPLFVQNYLLGIARVNLLPYVLISFPCSMTHILGFLLIGSAVFHENIMFAIGGFFFICFIMLLIKLTRDWMQHKKRQAVGV